MERIVLLQHDSEWLSQFDKEKKLLQDTFDSKIFQIHHVGSTAVPGLLAKPVVDIAIESEIYPPSLEIQNQLAGIGYQGHGEAGVQGRYWFTKGHPRLINLHFCAVGSSIVKSQLKFRDALMAYPELRAEYESLKLINSLNKDIDDTDYAQSKSKLIETVLSGRYSTDKP